MALKTMARSQRWQKPLQSFLVAAVGIVCFVATAFADEPSRDWPRWRGPKADGVADNRKLPTRWSSSENIRWSVKLPGWGTSSPVAYGNRVFVTSELNQEGKKSLLTLGFDRAEGDESPADCRSAGFFVEEIGLHDGVVWRHGFQRMLMRDGSLTHFWETRDERREGLSERVRPGDSAA